MIEDTKISIFVKLHKTEILTPSKVLLDIEILVIDNNGFLSEELSMSSGNKQSNIFTNEKGRIRTDFVVDYDIRKRIIIKLKPVNSLEPETVFEISPKGFEDKIQKLEKANNQKSAEIERLNDHLIKQKREVERSQKVCTEEVSQLNEIIKKSKYELELLRTNNKKLKNDNYVLDTENSSLKNAIQQEKKQYNLHIGMKERKLALKKAKSASKEELISLITLFIKEHLTKISITEGSNSTFNIPVDNFKISMSKDGILSYSTTSNKYKANFELDLRIIKTIKMKLSGGYGEGQDTSRDSIKIELNNYLVVWASRTIENIHSLEMEFQFKQNRFKKKNANEFISYVNRLNEIIKYD